MDLNKFVFPAPSSSYTPSSLENLFWIPRTRFFSMKSLVKSSDKFENYINSKTSDVNGNTGKQSQTYIPCHFQSCGDGHKSLILYFHGNAEDIGYAAHFAKRLGIELKADVLAIEYPGYGVYEGDTNAKTILEDAEIVYDFLTTEAGVKPEHIIVFGRSIGSGPATHLAANRKPGALILMSPYTSIKSVVKDIAGSLVSSLVAERFNNIEEIEKAECPCFFIHGKKDKIIPLSHSQELFVRCKSIAAVGFSESMSHNKFNMSNDIVYPVRRFLRQIGFTVQEGRINFPSYVTKLPMKNCLPHHKNTVARIADAVLYEA